MREDLRHSRENEEISTSVKEELERSAMDTVEEMGREKEKEKKRGKERGGGGGGGGWRGGDDGWKEVGRRGGTERVTGKQGGREHSLNRDKK